MLQDVPEFWGLMLAHPDPDVDLTKRSILGLMEQVEEKLMGK